MMQCSLSSYMPIRARYWVTSSRDVRRPCSIAVRISEMLASTTLNERCVAAACLSWPCRIKTSVARAKDNKSRIRFIGIYCTYSARAGSLAEDLRLHRPQRHSNGMQRTSADAAIHFLHFHRAGSMRHNRARCDRLRLVAVQDSIRIAGAAQLLFDNHVDRYLLRSRVRRRDDFLVVQNAGKSKDSTGEWRDSVALAISRNGTEVLASIAQGGLLTPHCRNLFERQVKRIRPVESRAAPQGFPAGFVGAAAVQSLFRAVVDARNPLQGEEARQAQRHLAVEFVHIGWIDEADTLLDIVIIQKRGKKTRHAPARPPPPLSHPLPQ